MALDAALAWRADCAASRGFTLLEFSAPYARVKGRLGASSTPFAPSFPCHPRATPPPAPTSAPPSPSRPSQAISGNRKNSWHPSRKRMPHSRPARNPAYSEPLEPTWPEAPVKCAFPGNSPSRPRPPPCHGGLPAHSRRADLRTPIDTDSRRACPPAQNCRRTPTPADLPRTPRKTGISREPARQPAIYRRFRTA